MKDLKELFQKLNENVEYLVLRNWENLPYATTPGHDDIDILTNDLEKAVSVLQAEKTYSENFRVQYKVLVGGECQLLDIRFVGDDYYPKKFEKRLLKNRVFNGSIYKPCKEDGFHALLYHALFHKSSIKPDYIEMFKQYIADKVGGVTTPQDLSVQFSIKNLIYNRDQEGTTSKIEVFYEDDVFCVKKIYPFQYKHCLENEIKALKKISKFDSKHFPKLLKYDDNSITIDHCGDRIACFNLPNDWREQSQNIIETLEKADVVHRDITPLNLHVSFGIIKLIDFGWATTFSSKDEKGNMTPDEWENLGLLWRHPGGFDDSYSIDKVLTEFYLQKLGKTAPKAKFASSR